MANTLGSYPSNLGSIPGPRIEIERFISKYVFSIIWN